MDELLQGDMKERVDVDSAGYDKHMNRQSMAMSLGVGAILLGTSVYCFMEGYGVVEQIRNLAFLIFAIIGILILVFYGLQDESYKRRHPALPQGIYSEQEIETFHHRFALYMTIGVALILIGIVIEQLLEYSTKDFYAYGVFMVLITLAVMVFIYFGLQKSKYEYTAIRSLKIKEQEEKIGKYCACIMLITTALYLLVSFIWGCWNISWILYAIGGILCGIVTILLKKEES